jgi:hypothetical protein
MRPVLLAVAGAIAAQAGTHSSPGHRSSPVWCKRVRSIRTHPPAVPRASPHLREWITRPSGLGTARPILFHLFFAGDLQAPPSASLHSVSRRPSASTTRTAALWDAILVILAWSCGVDAIAASLRPGIMCVKGVRIDTPVGAEQSRTAYSNTSTESAAAIESAFTAAASRLQAKTSMRCTCSAKSV